MAQLADGEMEPALAASWVVPKISASRSTSASVWQTTNTSWPAPGCVQFVADLADVAAEPLDRLDLQPAGRLQRAGRHGRRGDRGKPQHLLQHGVGTLCNSCGRRARSR